MTWAAVAIGVGSAAGGYLASQGGKGYKPYIPQIDYGTVAQRGQNVATSLQPQTVKANLANVQGRGDILNYYQNLISTPLNEAGMADLMSQFNANAGLRSPGGMNSPATMLQNVFGVEAAKRGIRNEAASNLFGATRNELLNTLQPNEAISQALQAEGANAQGFQNQNAIDAQLGLGPYGQSDSQKYGQLLMGGAGLAGGGMYAGMLSGAGGGARAGGVPGSLGGMSSGAQAGAGVGGFGAGSQFQALNPAAAGRGGGGGMTPYEQAALRLQMMGGGFQLGQGVARSLF
jgi:hypothetical protein